MCRNKYFTFRDRSVVVRVNKHDGQTLLRKIEFVLKYRGQLLGVLLLSDSPGKDLETRSLLVAAPKLVGGALHLDFLASPRSPNSSPSTQRPKRRTTRTLMSRRRRTRRMTPPPDLSSLLAWLGSQS